MDGYVLAIDFGTSATAGVIRDAAGSEIVEIGGSPRVASTVAALDDAELVAGDAAVRQLATNPDRVERAPKRRLGDRAVLLGDRPVSPTALAAAVLKLVADEAARRRGGAAPDEVRLTHPASWASTRLEALRVAAAQAGLPTPLLLPEPVAAALQLSDGRLAVGDHVAVYDLGGGTFDAAVLERTETGFALTGPPGGNDRVGGEDLDEKLLEHVGAGIREQDSEAWERLRFSDERAWRRAAAALRTETRAAKEALSAAPKATIYIPAPVDVEVQVTREELESLARADLERTVDELVATVERSGVALQDLSAIYLVGGASRMPLVGRLVAERTGIVPTTWGDPKAAVALGAALAPAALLSHADDQRTTVLPVVTVPPQAPSHGRKAEPAPGTAVSEAPRSPVHEVATAVTPPPGAPVVNSAALPREEGAGRSRRTMVVAAVVAVAVVAAAGAFLATRDGQGSGAVPPVQLAAYEFAVAGDATVRSERAWALDAAGTTLTNTTVLTNAGSTPITRTALEVVPKQVAPTVADLELEPGFTVVQDDPVVRYEVKLAPGASRTLTWTAELKDAAGLSELTELALAQRKAEKDFLPLLPRLVPATVTATAPVIPFADTPDAGATTSASPVASRTPEVVPPPGVVTAEPVPPPGVEQPITKPQPVEPKPTSTRSVPTPRSTTEKPVVVLKPPGAPGGGVARFTRVASRVSGRQDVASVSLSLSWGRPTSGGAVSSYQVRRSLVTGSGARSVQSTTSTSGTSVSLTVPACNAGGGRYAWEVRARNKAGDSPWTTLSAGIVNMNGQLGFDGTQMIRTAGAIVSYNGQGGERPAPSSDQAYKVYYQSPTGGVVAPGSTVALYYYGEYTAPG